MAAFAKSNSTSVVPDTDLNGNVGEGQNGLSDLLQRMFEHIVEQDGVFYKSQQRGESDFSREDKLSILAELFARKPLVFLERYHTNLNSDFIELFERDNESDIFLKKISTKSKTASSERRTRNLRYAEMLRLQTDGSYFSNEKMRERDPELFELMVGKYLEDHEKFQLRPTVEIPLSNGGFSSAFTGLLDEYSESRICLESRGRNIYDAGCSNTDATDRFMNHVNLRTCENDDEEKEEFKVEFDSSDEEGREAEEIRQKQLMKKRHCDKKDPIVFMKAFKDRLSGTEKALRDGNDEDNKESTDLTDFSTMKVSNDRDLKEDKCDEAVCSASETWSSGDEDEAQVTGIPKESLYDEFVSIMEQRFLSGRDEPFFDYSRIDQGMENSRELNRIKEQDLEDAYFDND